MEQKLQNTMNFVGLIMISAICLTSQAETFEVTTEERVVRIKNNPAILGQFAYQAAIYYTRADGKHYFCGGALINREWVITSGHCVNESSEWDVKLGSLAKNKFDIEPEEIYETCTVGMYYPHYGAERFRHDVGLIKMPYPLKLTYRIQPVRLPRQSEKKGTLVGQHVIVSGWGQTTTGKKARLSPKMLYTNLEIIPIDKCRMYFNKIIYHATICAVGINEGICHGDSGGPLVRIDDDGRKTLIGIVTFVHTAGCFVKYPYGFIRVDHYVGWISKVTGIKIRP